MRCLQIALASLFIWKTFDFTLSLPPHGDGEAAEGIVRCNPEKHPSNCMAVTVSMSAVPFLCEHRTAVSAALALGRAHRPMPFARHFLVHIL